MFIYGNLRMVGFEPRNNLLLITYAAATCKITQWGVLMFDNAQVVQQSC